jgi:hypothetical protein
MDLNLLANIAMICLFLGTLPSIVTLIKNKNKLEGFSLLGSFPMMFGEVAFLAYFALIPDYVTVALLLPLAVYWMVVIGLKLKIINKNR